MNAQIVPISTTPPERPNIGHGILSGAASLLRENLPKAERVCILSDTNVAPLYLPRVQASLGACGLAQSSYVIPAGEASKNGSNFLALLEFLASEGFTRTDALLCLGGGVVGDLGGFVAATYLRGIPVVQAPTSLLAMVDSSLGGKTGIDLIAGKNLAGAFHQPRFTLCDVSTLQSLPPEQFGDGCAEIIKYGMLGSEVLLTQLQAAPLCPAASTDLSSPLAQVIAQCTHMKLGIVARDAFDTGERQLLNLGHTLGHAIERCSQYEISHGRAVAIGMALITRAAVQKGLCPPAVLQTLEALLALYQLPDRCPYSAQELLAAALGDKKREGGSLTLIVPRALGRAERHTIPVTELPSWIEAGLCL